MKKILVSLLMLILTSAVSYGLDLSFNVKLETAGGNYDGKTEEQLKARNSAWAKQWEEVIKPSIYDDIITVFDKHFLDRRFGHYSDAKYDLIISVVEMDEDGETEAMVTITNNQTGELVYSATFQKNGDSTQGFTKITSKSLVRVARAVVPKMEKFK